MIYVAPSAVLVGDVMVEDGASVWHGAVLRGDFDAVVVGRDSNVQDNVVVHVDRGMPARIGARVTVGHAAVVHGCTIADDCLIGMNATVNSGATIGSGSLVASGAVVRESAEFPAGTLIAGVPAKAIREVDETLRRRIELSWSIYRELAKTRLPSKSPIRGDVSKQAVFDLSKEFTRLIRRE
jgi:carbonic anhydrase/acetyltransferase-like protein (isoleucine patch superfamily)